MLVHKYKLMNEEMGGDVSGGVAVAAAAPAPAPAVSEPAPIPVVSAPVAPAPAAPTQAQGVWPDGWRERFAGNDEKRKNIASRFTSPEAVFDALINAQDKIRSGNLKEIKPFPEKGTPEQQTQWRKENGLPEAPDKYTLNGLTVGEDDKPFVDEFLKVAHADNMTDAQATKAIDWYFKSRELQMQAQDEQDRATSAEVQRTLREEWGGDYQGNKARIDALLNSAPPGVRDNLINARYPDGSAVFNDPNVLRFFAGLQLQIDPVGTLVGGSGNPVDMVSDEIAKINKFMVTNRKEYFADQAMQERYRKLIDARDGLTRKAS